MGQASERAAAALLQKRREMWLLEGVASQHDTEATRGAGKMECTKKTPLLKGKQGIMWQRKKRKNPVCIA